MDTITITFPQVKVKIPIKDLTFDILEDMLFEILQILNLPRFTGHQVKSYN